MIKVLDHGFARLVSYMQPANCIEEASTWTGDLEIVRNARVSYDADWRSGQDEGKDAKLIAFLLKNGHWSPFEAMNFTFEIKAPIFIFRQWHRHWSWRFNEVSARYSELPEEFYVPDPSQITTQSKTNKQARTDEPLEDAAVIAERMREWNGDAFEGYRTLLAAGVPRELARTVLPLATYSRMFTTTNLRNIFVFCRSRLDEHAQYEIRVYAKALLELIEPICPAACAAFKETL
jgi:thymidylate synthase (FAD)